MHAICSLTLAFAGTWLTDLARTLNTGRTDLKLHGMDLGSTLFRLDAELDIRKHDLRSPVTDSWGWKSNFDLVHQRLLVCGIGKEEWSGVILNLADLVKPDGVLYEPTHLASFGQQLRGPCAILNALRCSTITETEALNANVCKAQLLE
ncbi:hypothetical protein T440DRAFT_464748 [Plenodomus tracheiphilus IPT5]|uniref:Uncharacterized protein n=1 Tax=Plenodomus tracheiphilus IPT5 TaxID=1408161 RepID=A0A6A7BGF3_9PLEO|nr:hypothetical protein T440DRAFT_464748 [Plenodomus tracheiphilus IPT5]